ncbi:aspartyl protease [Scytonema sp. UIC 10036]|uniref:aspartyl protease n=1 Tax=Scytonema sp. UIC 10036 TaxID=2304196 RepID=UPI0012DA4271|nr:aspartyl protease [Scytonema sp. UIC 10036]MUG99481.1 aspartyl protease [Scytonema sp. UIC 10036]
MIEGRFGDGDELFFEIQLVANEQLDLPVDAMLDTGFSGWLAIDKQDLDGFDWILIGERDMLLAKGETKFDIYAGKVKIEEQEFDVLVHVGTGLTEVLLGRQWLKDRRLVVDIPSGILTLGQ